MNYKSLAKKHLLTVALGLLVLFFSGLSQAQITPLGDAYTNSADATTNYGANVLLYVDGAKETTYIQFNLASIPSGASVSQATLKLYLNAVTTAGSFNVDYVNGSWSEGTIDYSNAPALGSTIASNVSVTTADKNQYILVNVTSAVQAWLSGSETNNGLALVANSTFNASFDSKENTTTSHPPELDIVFAPGSGGGGTITGVTAGTDLTGGGTSGNVTLNLNTSALNSTYAQLNGGNTFSGNQTVNGDLYALVSNGTVAVTGLDQSSGGSTGVLGSSVEAYGVFGNSTYGDGVYGQSGNIGVQALGGSYGVYGTGGATGVFGSGTSYGVLGGSSGSGSIAVFGLASSGGTGVQGDGTIGVSGNSSVGSGGVGVAAYNTSTGDALFAENQSGGYAAFFLGNVDVDGNLAKAGGSFKIDDPLDPANKYLYHSFVESPDMKNIYDGVVITDANGEAVVQLPDWFEALNRDFRYQLTVVGQFAQAIVKSEVANNQFTIQTDKPGVKVSWQVTGIRQDAWAKAHRIPVEVSKGADRGLYLHPELFGAPPEKSIAMAHHPVIPKKPITPKQPGQAPAKGAATK